MIGVCKKYLIQKLKDAGIKSKLLNQDLQLGQMIYMPGHINLEKKVEG